MSQKNLKDALKKAVTRITAPKVWPATIIGEGSHPTRSLVQLSNGVQMEVLNTATMALAGQHVRIGYSQQNPGELQVLGIIGSTAVLNQLYPYNYMIRSHHKNHEAPNPDMVYVYGIAFMPDSVMPYRGLSVIVNGEVAWDGSDWKTPARKVVNLSTHVPGSGCRYVLLEADGEDVIVTDGSSVASISLLTLDKLPDPTAGRKPLAGVVLRSGQTDIVQDVRVGKRNDILDLRWTGGTGGGGSYDLAADVHAATSKTTPADSDEVGATDSAASYTLKKWTWANIKAALKTYFDTLYAATAKGVTNGDSHDHNGGDGAQINHTTLSNIGTNTHATIDSHLGSTSNPHSVTAAQAVAIPESGWIERSETWTRTGNHTFTISGDVTATFRKGTKVRYKDGGSYEYGIVISSSYSAPNTTVTLAANSDYAMASNPTDRAISFVENPEGFPTSFSIATTTSITSSAGSLSNIVVGVAKIAIIGGEIKFWFDVTFDLGSATALSIFASLPVTPAFATAFVAGCRDASSGAVPVGLGLAGAANGTYWRLLSGSNWSVGNNKRFYGSGSVLF